jgi:hypothetical protein
MIRVVHPGLNPGTGFFTRSGSRIQGSKRLQIRNTAFNFIMFLSQLKRELVVSCCGELIALHTEIANLIVDVASVVDTETQVENLLTCYLKRSILSAV